MSDNEIITLIPNVGEPLTLDGAILVTDVDWGTRAHQTAISEGPEINGGSPGAGTRPTVASQIKLLIDPTDDDYVASAAAFERAVAALTTTKGWVRRQRRLPSGDLLEAVDAEVLNAEHTDPGEFLLERELSLTRQPGWHPTSWDAAGSYEGSDPVADVKLDVRGDELAIARLRWIDQDSEGARFAIVGQEWSHYDSVSPAGLHYEAADFELAEATLESDTDATGGQALELTPLVPTWRTLCYLRDLTHAGVWNALGRVKFPGDADFEITVRLAYRAGAGRWQVNDPVVVRSSSPEAYHLLKLGQIHRLDESSTMDVRIEVESPNGVDATNPVRIDCLDLIPVERHVTLRGLSVVESGDSLEAMDNFSGGAVGDPLDAETALHGGDAWDEEGNVSQRWHFADGPSARRYSGTESDVQSGGLALLGTTDYTNVRVVAALKARNDPFVEGVPWTRCGIVLRYVDANNYLAAVVQYSSPNRIIFYRRIGGTTTAFYSKAGADADAAVLAVSLSADGSWALESGPFRETGLTTTRTLAQGTHASLATGGALETGQVGIYMASQTSQGNAEGSVHGIAVFGEFTSADPVHVVRPDGIGVHGHRASYSAETDDSDKQPLTPDGLYFRVPPGESRLASLLRVGDSDSEPDVLPSGDQSFVVEVRPAFTGHPDALLLTWRQFLASLDPAVWWDLAANGATDLSGNGRHGTGQGSIDIGGHDDSPVSGESASTDFDGSDDRITSEYGTRRNYLPEPIFENQAGSGLTGTWTAGGSNTVESVAVDVGHGDLTRALEVTYQDTNNPLVRHERDFTIPDESLWATALIYIPEEWDGGAISIAPTFLAGHTILDSSNQSSSLKDSWHLIDVQFEPDAADLLARLFFFVSGGSVPTAGRSFQVAWAGVTKDRITDPDDIFPTITQLESGAAGWLGTAHASASDKGVFANGTVRSWGDFAARDDTAAAHTLLGGDATSNATRLVLASGSRNVLLIIGGTTYTFTDAWPDDTDSHRWDLVLDEPGDTASLYIDGALAEEKATVTAQHAAGQSLVLGAHGSGSDPYDGKRAHFAGFERGLTADEIADLYTAATEGGVVVPVAS